MKDCDSITRVANLARADELLSLIGTHTTRHRNHLQRPTHLFRGHASDAWILQPSALRLGAFREVFAVGDRLSEPITQLDQLLGELRIVFGFLHEADAMGLAIPEDSVPFREMLERNTERLLSGADHTDQVIWPPRQFYALLALVRHSGLPTRLLDWTSDAKKAAYFAASKAAEFIASGAISIDGADRMSVWTIDRSRFKSLVHFGRNIGSMFDDRYELPVELFSVPRASNPNAHAQSGWFSVERLTHNLTGSVPRNPLDFAIAKLLPEELPMPVFWKYTLPLSEVPSLLALLADHDVKASSVFPGYHGAALAVREARYYEHLFCPH